MPKVEINGIQKKKKIQRRHKVREQMAEVYTQKVDLNQIILT